MDRCNITFVPNATILGLLAIGLHSRTAPLSLICFSKDITVASAILHLDSVVYEIYHTKRRARYFSVPPKMASLFEHTNTIPALTFLISVK